MAPPKIYRSITPVHFHAETDRAKEFEELCRRERKTKTQMLNELINEKLERNCISRDDMPTGENISCLGYSPTPVQRRIIDDDNNIINTEDRFNIENLPTIPEWVIYLQKLDNAQKIGAVHGYGKRLADISKVRLHQINSTIMKA